MNELVAEQVILVDCPKCGQLKEAHHIDQHMCIDCTKAENNRYMYTRQHQTDWLEIAKEAGLDVWVQQPDETQWEYTIWVAYRDSYPGQKPDYGTVARQLNTTYNVVRKAAQRWSFQIRMQAWMRHCDEITLAQRHSEILDMNKQNIDMAASLRLKIKTAIAHLRPEEMDAREIVAVAKLATELERTARIDSMAVEDDRRNAAQGNNDNPNSAKQLTKHSDIPEVLRVLQEAGVLGKSSVGIKQTTEIIMKED